MKLTEYQGGSELETFITLQDECGLCTSNLVETVSDKEAVTG